ncbi:MAG: histone deacetylase family protein, partial [Pseudomonadota bacterium]
PGHHAESDLVGGFCYFNNSAIAAQMLLDQFERVAIIDVDVHHGNGTQQIFYHRDDVFTLSLHADPRRFYPFFWGYAEETGNGAGLGCNLNIPLERGTEDGPYLDELNHALERVNDFQPDALVISLGLDASIDDPFQGLRITPDGFGNIGRRLAALAKPTLLVQEGGYMSDNLSLNLQAVLAAFQ